MCETGTQKVRVVGYNIATNEPHWGGKEAGEELPLASIQKILRGSRFWDSLPWYIMNEKEGYFSHAAILADALPNFSCLCEDILDIKRVGSRWGGNLMSGKIERWLSDKPYYVLRMSPVSSATAVNDPNRAQSSPSTLWGGTSSPRKG